MIEEQMIHGMWRERRSSKGDVERQERGPIPTRANRIGYADCSVCRCSGGLGGGQRLARCGAAYFLGWATNGTG